MESQWFRVNRQITPLAGAEPIIAAHCDNSLTNKKNRRIPCRVDGMSSIILGSPASVLVFRHRLRLHDAPRNEVNHVAIRCAIANLTPYYLHPSRQPERAGSLAIWWRVGLLGWWKWP